MQEDRNRLEEKRVGTLRSQVCWLVGLLMSVWVMHGGMISCDEHVIWMALHPPGQVCASDMVSGLNFECEWMWSMGQVGVIDLIGLGGVLRGVVR